MKNKDLANEPVFLTKTNLEAEKIINDRINKGKLVLQKVILSNEELNDLKADYSKWDDYNTELLTNLFTSKKIVNQYNEFIRGGVTYPAPLVKLAEKTKKEIIDKITKLESIRERLSLYKVQNSSISNVSTGSGPKVKVNDKKVFIVHGHDNGIKESVARFLGKLELEAIILHEQASSCNTLIEKFEKNAAVAFAIVLLTPDDVGASKENQDNLSQRARQNVVFELGYFMGHLGREKVCALLSEGVEKPSDFEGIVYINPNSDDWKLKLAKELKEAGLKIDMNKTL